ncbi:MAG: M67 family metallopeptidase [Nitrospirae bacterium]|nr:M67 family metallopeptidase [Nitrospirota bacterium]
MPELRMSGELAAQMLKHCRAGYPNEACGILAGKSGTVVKVYLMPNAEPSPVSYVMEPKEQFRVMQEMRQEELSMLAIFHSHPQSPAYPSATDIRLAFYQDVVYVIIGLTNPESPDIKAYTIIEGEVIDAAIRILD